MECPSCRTGNRDGAAFCSGCGSGLTDTTSLGASDADASRVVSGRYRITGLIGEGAMKTVYRAHDETLDLDIALAFFNPESISSRDRPRIEREVRSMVSLGGHHSIMRIVDYGEDEGRQFIVTPLMAGGDLATQIKSSGPLEIDDLLQLGKAMSDALGHAHSMGVLHRDVKPENVWYDADRRPHLGDFGLAVSIGESRITQEGTVLGTPAYLAPECASGGLAAGPLSDLYSLGVLLYEAAVGHLPFGGAISEVISQHLSVEPVAPKAHRPDLPAGVESLILSLMAKSPERRPQSAAEVGEALAELITARTSGSGAEHVAQAGSRRFVGRTAEMTRAREAVDSAAAGSATFVTVSGEPGIGKTRLAEEAISYAELRGFVHATGRCVEDEGSPAFWPWQQVLRALMERCEVTSLRSALGVGGPVLARVLPEVSEVLPGLLPAPAPADPDQARFQLFDTIAAFIRRLSVMHPLFVLLEDIHWADTPSLKLLQFVSSSCDRERLLIAATYRDVELGRHHPLSGALAELAKDDRSVRISLSGMEHGEVAELVGAMGGGRVADELIGEIEMRTEGNPFFIAEVMRLIEESGDGSWSFAVPQGVRETLGYRLNQLGEDANRVLAIAAVIGREFPLNLLEAAADGVAGDALSAVIDAEDSGLVGESGERTGTYSFAHALIRETLYQELSTARRAMYHRRVANAIESLYHDRLQTHLAELAHHLLKSSASESAAKAVRYLVDAGKHSLDMFAYEDAVENFETALEAIELAGIERTEIECQVLVHLGDALWRQREGDRAKEYLERALDLARELALWNEFARAVLLLPGQTAGFGFVAFDIDNLVVEALGNLDSGGDALRSKLLALRSWSMWDSSESSGLFAERASIVEQALELADRSGDTGARVGARAACAMHLAFPDRTEERKQWAGEIIEISQGVEDWDGVIQGLTIRAAAHYELAAIDAARSDIEEMESIVESGKPASRGWMLKIIKALDAQLVGNFKAAEEYASANMTLTKAGDRQEGLKMVAIVALTNVLLAEQGRQEEIAIIYAAGAKGYKRSLLMRGPIAPLIDIYAQIGETEKAKQWMSDLRADGFAIEPSHQWLSNVSYLASACAKLGDVPAARDIYALLAPFVDRFVVVGSGVACLGSGRRAAGQLAATIGEIDLARTHFELGISANARVGARPYEAHCHRELAEVIINSGVESRGEALAHIDAAIGLYQDCGMEYWRAQAASLRG